MEVRTLSYSKKNETLLGLGKAIRALSVPPLMASVLLVTLFVLRPYTYLTTLDFIMALVFLAVLPLLAYPLSYIIPSIRKKSRSGQRNLAFALCALGYLGALIYAYLIPVSQALLFVFLTYAISVAFLLLLNKVIKVKASGHACSVVGPLIMLVYLIGWPAVIPCTLAVGLVAWSSVYTESHSLAELLAGGMCAALAFLISFLILAL